MSPAEIAALLDEADVLIYHFLGWENGISIDKPSAFRNINIYYSKDSGLHWTDSQYNAASYDRYKLVSCCHPGAIDFLPPDRFRWLPDLLPLDGAYAFDPADRPFPAVSYIKHAEELSLRDFGSVAHLSCFNTPHARVLARRRSSASVVIDNVNLGHYGAAGQEAAILGLPVVVFNHRRQLEAMAGWEKPGMEFPFTQAETLDEAVDLAVQLAMESSRDYRRRRAAIRKWSEKFFSPRRLVREYWDPFIDELGSFR